MNRSVLVAAVCRGGKIFGVGRGTESSEKLRSTLQMLNYEFTVFVKVEFEEEPGMLNLRANYKSCF